MSLSEQIYQRIHEKIAAGALDPSKRVTETWLASMLGVSRTPLRAALVRLRQEGLLGGAGAGGVTAALTRADLDEIMEVRMLIEPQVAALAAERADPRGVERLVDALTEEIAASNLRSAKRFAIANHDFRVCYLKLAANSRLAESASRYDSQIQALRRLSLKSIEHRVTVVEHHKRLVHAIAQGDGALANAVMSDLLEKARVAILLLADKKPALRGGA